VALFSNKQEANLRTCIRMVEDALSSLGHTPDDCRTDSPDDLPAWRAPVDAQHIDVHLGVDGDKNVLRVLAGVGKVRAGLDEAALFRRLLELNVTDVKGVAFGLSDGEVVLVSERTTVDLDPSEVMDILRRAERFAAHYAGLLAGELDH
jgi:type III secretion system-like peptide-binding chaperone